MTFACPSSRGCYRWWPRCLIALVVTSSAAIADEKFEAGLRLYQSKCAVCHGERGEGTAEYEPPLVGDLAAAQLAGVVRETMPADDPGSLTPHEARAIADYMHQAFYSSIAQARNRPPRIELARLTVEQHRRALADLAQRWGTRFPESPERGLRGDYFSGRHVRGETERVARRIDPVVDFTFGTEKPVEEIEDARNYSARWTGSLVAPETGEYELLLRSEHAVRLWVNGGEAPAVDGWVRSGDDTEFRGRIFLLGGRYYPLRLEFSRGTQGVSDEEVQKRNLVEQNASVALLWRPPHGEVQVIASRYLSPESVPASLACRTPFPPDDRSYGWERGTTVSQEWDEATTAAAIAMADYIEQNLHHLAGVRPGEAGREERIEEFCVRFVEQAFRAPLTPQHRELYVERHLAAEETLERGVRRLVLATLKSPRFLYREVGEAPAPYHTASRLAFGLWDSIPDRELTDQAARDRLSSPEEIRRQAERMLKDPRAADKLQRFLLTWLQVESSTDLGKTSEQFPGFDAQLVGDLRMSLEMAVSEILASTPSDFRQLFLSETVYLNENLADFYGVEWPGGDGFQPIRLDNGARAGVLTHPYMMARFATHAESSPIHRGVFLARSVLGQTLRPPPEAVAPLAPDLHPDLTTRERVVLQTRPASCMTCHTVINPLGFTLERFDAVGRYRDQDRNRPIDDVGEYQPRAGEPVRLRGARELGEFLATSDEVHGAFVQQMFQFLVQQSAQAYGSEVLEELRAKFVRDGFDMRKLAVEIMVVSAPVGREAPSTQ